ncbi:MAG: exo-alpha-sialidase [Candidatus Aminicenantes bacterium]|nr:exo-alpha-sialidase [Candidatus Aminicenantes bacterium]
MKRGSFFFIHIIFFLFIPLALFGATNLSKSNNHSFWADIAIAPNGKIMVIWMDDIGGTGDVFYSISTDNGNSWSSAKRTYSANEYVKAPTIAVDSSSNFHIAYSDGYSSGSRDIYYRCYKNNSWQSVEQVHQYGDNSNWSNIDVSGNQVYIAWYQELGGSKHPIIALKSKNIGGSWPTSFQNFSNDSENGYMYPDLSVIGGNIYMIFRIHVVRGGEIVSKHLVFKEKVNGVLKPTERVGTYTWPAIEADEYHNIHCLYPNSSSTGYAVYRSRINGTWQEEKVLNNMEVLSGFFDIHYKNNTLIAAFPQDPGGRNWSIYFCVREYSGGWKEWGSPQLLEQGSEAEFPEIDIDPQGYAHIVWCDSGYGGDTDIFYKKVHIGGASEPYINVDKDTLNFAVVEGNSESQTLKIRNSGAKTLNFSLSTNRGWLTVSPMSGSSTGDWKNITVTASATSTTSGNESGEITITSSNAANSPQKVDVTMQVGTATPTILLDKTALYFTHTQGDSNPASQEFKIKNFGNGSMSYSISSDALWCTPSPRNGSSSGEWDSIGVSVDAASLAVGSHDAYLTIKSDDADNSPQKVKVNVSVSKGAQSAIQLDKTSLDFTQKKGIDLQPQKFKIRNSGERTLYYTFTKNRDWITLNPMQGSSNGEWDEITVSINSGSLTGGTYTGTITITASNCANSPQTIRVTFTKQKPTIQLNKNQLSFFGYANGDDPNEQYFDISNSGFGTLQYTLEPNKSWALVSPRSGTSTGEWDIISVSINISELWLGNHESKIKVSAPDADRSPQYVTVKVTVEKPPIPYRPENVRCERFDNIGLFIKNYVNLITWQKTSKNDNLFTITKFRIYRKEQGASDSSWEFMTEIPVDAGWEYEDNMGTKEERDKYVYAVSEVDDQEKESHKAVSTLKNS